MPPNLSLVDEVMILYKKSQDHDKTIKELSEIVEKLTKATKTTELRLKKLEDTSLKK